MTTLRIPTESRRKHLFLLRSNVIETLIEAFGISREEAREKESKYIYREGHDCFQHYADIAIEYISSIALGREPFEQPEGESKVDDEEDFKVSEEQLRSFFAVNLDDVVSGSKVMSRCPVCRSTEVQSNAVQTRSADEGMTLMNRCERCGHQWKE